MVEYPEYYSDDDTSVPLEGEKRFNIELDDVLGGLCMSGKMEPLKKFLERYTEPTTGLGRHENTAGQQLVKKHAMEIVNAVKGFSQGPEIIARLLPAFCRIHNDDVYNDDVGENVYQWQEPMAEIWNFCLGPKASPATKKIAVHSFMSLGSTASVRITPETAELLLTACQQLDLGREKFPAIERVIWSVESQEALWPKLISLLRNDTLTKTEFSRVCEDLLRLQCLSPQQEAELVSWATKSKLSSVESVLAVAYVGRRVRNQDFLSQAAPSVLKELGEHFFTTVESPDLKNDRILKKWPSSMDFVNLLIQHTNPDTVTRWIEHIIHSPQAEHMEVYSLAEIKGYVWTVPLAEKFLNKIKDLGPCDEGSWGLASIVGFILRQDTVNLSHPMVQELLKTLLQSPLNQDNFATVKKLHSGWPEMLQTNDSVKVFLTGKYDQRAIDVLLTVPAVFRPNIMRFFRSVVFEKKWTAEKLSALSNFTQALNLDDRLQQGLERRAKYVHSSGGLLEDIYMGDASPEGIEILAALPGELRNKFPTRMWLEIIHLKMRAGFEQFLQIANQDPNLLEKFTQKLDSARVQRAFIELLEKGGVTQEGLQAYCALSQEVGDMLNTDDAVEIMRSGTLVAAGIMNQLVQLGYQTSYSSQIQRFVCSDQWERLSQLEKDIKNNPTFLKKFVPVLLEQWDLHSLVDGSLTSEGIRVFSNLPPELEERLIGMYREIMKGGTLAGLSHLQHFIEIFSELGPTCLSKLDKKAVLSVLLDKEPNLAGFKAFNQYLMNDVSLKERFLQKIGLVEPDTQIAILNQIMRGIVITPTVEGVECFLTLTPPLINKLESMFYLSRILLEGSASTAKTLNAIFEEHPDHFQNLFDEIISQMSVSDPSIQAGMSVFFKLPAVLANRLKDFSSQSELFLKGTSETLLKLEGFLQSYPEWTPYLSEGSLVNILTGETSVLKGFEKLEGLLVANGPEFKKLFLEKLSDFGFGTSDFGFGTDASSLLDGIFKDGATSSGLECFVILPLEFIDPLSLRYLSDVLLGGIAQNAKIISSLCQLRSDLVLQQLLDYKKIITSDAAARSALHGWLKQDPELLARLINHVFPKTETKYYIQQASRLQHFVETLFGRAKLEGIQTIERLPSNLLKGLGAEQELRLLSDGTLEGLKNLEDFVGAHAELNPFLTADAITRTLCNDRETLGLKTFSEHLVKERGFKERLVSYLSTLKTPDEKLLSFTPATVAEKISPAGIKCFLTLSDTLMKKLALPNAIQVLTMGKAELARHLNALLAEYPNHFKQLSGELIAKIVIEGDQEPTISLVKQFSLLRDEVIKMLSSQ